MNPTVDPLLFPNRSLQLESLEHFLSSTSPLMLLLGNSGVGKNALLDQYVAKMQITRRIVRLQGQPSLQPSQLTTLLSHHWTIRLQENSVSQRYQLEQIIADLTERDESCLLIVDNAHHLPIATLAALSHLAIKQDGMRVYLHILLSGKPDLLKKASSLQNKPIPSLKLEPLTQEETRQYVQHFFNNIGEGENTPLAEDFIKSLHRQSGGYPSAIKQITQELAQQESFTPPASTEHTVESPTIQADKKTPPTLPSFWERHTVKMVSMGALCVVLVGLWHQKNISHPAITRVAEGSSQLLDLPNKTLSPKATPVTLAQATPTVQPVTPPQHSDPVQPKPTPVAQPVKATVVATRRVTHSAVKKAPVKKAVPQIARTGYTLQLIGSHKPKALYTFINQHHLKKSGQLLKTKQKGKEWYIVTYGHYSNRQQALQASKNLPKSLRTLSPWPRPLAAIYKAYSIQ